MTTNDEQAEVKKELLTTHGYLGLTLTEKHMHKHTVGF